MRTVNSPDPHDLDALADAADALVALDVDRQLARQQGQQLPHDDQVRLDALTARLDALLAALRYEGSGGQPRRDRTRRADSPRGTRAPRSME